MYVADLNFLEKSASVGGIQTSLQKPALRIGNFTRTLFTAATIIFFLSSIVGVMGLFLYYRYQKATLTDLLAQKADVEKDLQPQLVNRLVFIDSFISQARTLLQRHAFTTYTFTFLEKNIHADATIYSLSFFSDTKRLDIYIDVPSYLVLSEQVRTLEASPFVDRVSFGNPQINGDKIRFQVSIILKASLFGQKQPSGT